MIVKLLIILLLVQNSSFAAGVCGDIKAANDVLRCFRENAPEIISAKNQMEGSAAGINAATRWLNPEVTGKTVFGKNLGNEQIETEIVLEQPIELCGKRSSRREAAEAEVLKSEANLKGVEADVLTQGASDLFRLSQIKLEKELVEEAVTTFSRLIQQFASRPRLSAEQEVSLNCI